ncbi:phage tail tip fiber protein [Serratia ureilytica]|uniref:phage tail tip fiber protein n=1 Tax=Serratia ureilytica TaxID=300181 RepID=UPI0019CF7D16|nr:hypothetical protein [Serratia ureilytica]MBN5214286.1 hypothetical protein [Serratia ureilytica]
MAFVALAAVIAGASAAAAAAAAGMTMAAIVGIGLAAAAITGVMGYMGMQMSEPKFDSADTGATIGTTTDPKTVLPVVYGRERAGSIVVWRDVSKVDNTKLVSVFAICEGEIEGFHNLYLDNKRILKDSSPIFKDGLVDRSFIEDKYKDYVEVEFSTGTPNGHNMHLANFHLGNGDWPSDWVGKNVAMGCVVIKKTNDGLQDGVDIFNPSSQIAIELTGLRIMDLLDNQVKASDNGPSQLLDYIINSRYGLGVDPTYINTASFKEAAQFAYTNNFKSNGAMDPNATFKENITNLCGSFGGMMFESFGQLKLGMDAPDVVKYSFSDDNILQGTITLKDGGSMGYYNTLNATIRQPQADYSDIVYRYPSEEQNDAQIAKDKRIIAKDVSYRFVKDKAQLDRLASVERNKSTVQRQIAFNTTDAYGVGVWDVIRVSNTELQQTNSLWRVIRVHRALAGTVAGQIQIDAVEYNEKVYSDQDIAKDPNFNGSNIPDALILAAPTNLVVKGTGATAYGQNVALTWDAMDDFNRYGFRVQYKLAGAPETDWINAGFTSQKFFEIYNLTGEKYDFRVCATGVAARSEWVTLLNSTPATSYTLPGVTGLSLVNSMEDANTTKATEFRFAWDDQSAQKVEINGVQETYKDLFRYYEIKVTGQKTAVYKTTDTNFSYTWEQNVAHGLSRQITIGITAVGYAGNRSAEVKMVVKNKQHPVIDGFSAQAGIKVNGGMAFCSWTTSTEPDFAGTIIQYARDDNFTKEVGYKEYTGNQGNFDLDEGGWYIRAAQYDVFGQDNMIWTGPTYFDITFDYKFDPEDIKNIEDMIGLNDKLNETLNNANDHADEVASKAKEDAIKYTDNTKVEITGEYKTYTDGKVSAEQKRTDTLVANTELALNQKIDEQDAKFTKQVGDLETSTDANITEIKKSQSDFESATTQKFSEQKSEYTKLNSDNHELIVANSASIKTLDETVATEKEATAQQFSRIESKVDDNTSSITTLNKTVVTNDQAQSQALNQVRSEMDGKISAVSTESKTSIDKLTGTINASHTMTVDANGVYGGFKLLATDGEANGSAAIFSVDKFMITTADKDPNKVKPIFVADTANNEIYLDTARIRDASIGNAKIADASINSAKIANASIDSAKISQEIASDNWYSSGGTQGWAINKNGWANFRNVSVKGDIQADSGYFNGWVNANGGNFNNVVISENCTVRGRIEAQDGYFNGEIQASQIKGDLMDVEFDVKIYNMENRPSGGNNYDTTFCYIALQNFPTKIAIRGKMIAGFEGGGQSGRGSYTQMFLDDQLIQQWGGPGASAGDATATFSNSYISMPAGQGNRRIWFRTVNQTNGHAACGLVVDADLYIMKNKKMIWR